VVLTSPPSTVCDDETARAGLVVVDLRDSWMPLVLQASPYATTWIGLAAERFDVDGAGPRAKTDRYLEQWGIPANLHVLAARLSDAPRHACDALVDNAALSALNEPVRKGSRPPPARRGDDEVVNALQGHLVCEGLLRVDDADGVFGAATGRALATFQRKEAVLSEPGVLDDDTRLRLMQSSRVRDLQAVLRALRERVADAAGLIEDGSARGEQSPVLGLLLDPPTLRPLPVETGMTGAPDLVDRSTDLVARALGFTEVHVASDQRGVDPNAAIAVLQRALSWGRVAVAVVAPPWHSAHMEALSASVDLGDINTAGVGVRGGEAPALRLVTDVDGVTVTLVQWPTTIGGRQRVQLATGGIVRRNKASPAGMFVWRSIWSAPVWYPPRSTPDDELVLHSGHGVVVNDEGIGPGYRSAFGLVMIQHHNVLTNRDGAESFVDTGVRTHGTGSVRSVLTSSASHGCHRLLPRSALRLASFVLRHRAHTEPEPVLEGYSRVLDVSGRHLQLKRTLRGTRIDLTPPMPMEVMTTCPTNG
jgi:hypothetical protein